MVTLLKRIVFGLASRVGGATARSVVKPSLLLTSALVKADSAELPRGPMMRSICATSLPSPTSDSPTPSLVILAICTSSDGTKHRHPVEDSTRQMTYPCYRRPSVISIPLQYADHLGTGRLAR